MSENAVALEPGRESATMEPWHSAPDKKRAWTVVLSYPLYFLTMVILAVAITPIVGTHLTGTQSVALGITIPILSSPIVIALLWKQISQGGKHSLSDVLLLRHPPLKTMLFAVVMGILCQVLLAIAFAVVSSTGADLHSSTTTNRIGDSQGTLGKITVVLASSLGAPLAEEFFFRGFIFNNLAKGLGGTRRSVVLAALFSAATFSLMHLQGASSATDFMVLGWTFVMGLIMCWLARRSGSVWVPFTAHATYNSFIAVVLFT